MQFKRRFTAAEATKTLPLVKRIVADVLRTGRELRESEEGTREARRLESQLRGLMSELDQIGCYYKDWGFEMGLVDFPATIDGRDVFLCWRSDEPELTWYHAIEEGFQGRRPIPAELLEE